MSLLTQDIPIISLADRGVLYSLTHEVFYGTVFGRNKERYISIFNDKHTLKSFFEISILICIRNADIDVMLELLCSLFLLSLEDYISKGVWLNALHLVKISQRPDGSIPPYSNDLVKDTSKDVYHSTLVAGILLRILNSHDYS